MVGGTQGMGWDPRDGGCFPGVFFLINKFVNRVSVDVFGWIYMYIYIYIYTIYRLVYLNICMESTYIIYVYINIYLHTLRNLNVSAMSGLFFLPFYPFQMSGNP